jgi:hypothetical protein
MFIETNIPETTHHLNGGDDFGDPTFDLRIINDRTCKKQEILNFGNRCGHIPDEPRFYNRPENHKPRPSILENAIEKLKNVYQQPKTFFNHGWHGGHG